MGSVAPRKATCGSPIRRPHFGPETYAVQGCQPPRSRAMRRTVRPSMGSRISSTRPSIFNSGDIGAAAFKSLHVIVRRGAGCGWPTLGTGSDGMLPGNTTVGQTPSHRARTSPPTLDVQRVPGLGGCAEEQHDQYGRGRTSRACPSRLRLRLIRPSAHHRDLVTLAVTKHRR